VARLSRRSGQADEYRASSSSIFCGRFREAVCANAADDRMTHAFPQNAAVMTSDGTNLA
jgi:hypothetical protein